MSLPAGEPTAPAGVPEPTAAARAMFGARLPLAQAYAERLATDGTIRGLIGPREVPRLWDRHLVNCGALAAELRPGERVADVGSGAGLPGLVVALLRPDVDVLLIEPLLRRSTFLEETVAALGVTAVGVRRDRAEDCHDLRGAFDVVLARAVAPLDRLAGWCLPLLREGGRLLALKGATAAEELRGADAVLRRLGARGAQIRELALGLADAPPLVVEVVAGAPAPAGGRGGGRGRR